MYVAYASTRLDGICSAAILLRHARIRNKDIRLHFGNDSFSGKVIAFILDIVPSNEEFVHALTKNTRIAYWCYHQKTKHDNLIKQISSVADVSDSFCSAELVQQRFMPNDNVSSEIAHIARSHEFWLNNDSRATKLADIIASGFDMKELAVVLSRGVFWTDFFESLHKNYLIKRAAHLREMERSLVLKDYVGQNTAFFACKTALPSDYAGEHGLKYSGADFVVLLYPDGKIIFRKKQGNKTNMASIASIFGGGGNTFASGAHLHKKIVQNTIENIIFFIDNELKRFFFR